MNLGGSFPLPAQSEKGHLWAHCSRCLRKDTFERRGGTSKAYFEKRYQTTAAILGCALSETELKGVFYFFLMQSFFLGAATQRRLFGDDTAERKSNPVSFLLPVSEPGNCRYPGCWWIRKSGTCKNLPSKRFDCRFWSECFAVPVPA